MRCALRVWQAAACCVLTARRKPKSSLNRLPPAAVGLLYRGHVCMLLWAGWQGLRRRALALSKALPGCATSDASAQPSAPARQTPESAIE